VLTARLPVDSCCRSLGVYALPPLTHNGEEIEIDGQGYVVTSLNIRYKVGAVSICFSTWVDSSIRS
jgi:hypothetical protein